MKTILLILALVLTMSISTEAGNKRANRKQNREYAQRADKCKAEQYRIQSSNQTHYSKRNSWQPRSTRR